MSTITYTLIALSIVAGLIAMGTAIAVKLSEHRATNEGRTRLRALNNALSLARGEPPDQHLEAPERQSVTEEDAQRIKAALGAWSKRTSDEWKELLEDKAQADAMAHAISEAKLRADGRGEMSLEDIFTKLATEEDRRADRSDRSGIADAKSEARYIALRQLLLSLLDDLPLDSLLLDPRVGAGSGRAPQFVSSGTLGALADSVNAAGPPR